MTQHNIDILEKHKHHWETMVKAQNLRGLNQHEKNELQEVARQEFFGPNYSPDWWCGDCCYEAVKAIYTQYEKYLSNGANSI